MAGLAIAAAGSIALATARAATELFAAAAVISVSDPATFTGVYLADAASFVVFIPVLARLRPAGPSAVWPSSGRPLAGGRLCLGSLRRHSPSAALASRRQPDPCS
jgi:hypothetical protein